MLVEGGRKGEVRDRRNLCVFPVHNRASTPTMLLMLRALQPSAFFRIFSLATPSLHAKICIVKTGKATVQSDGGGTMTGFLRLYIQQKRTKQTKFFLRCLLCKPVSNGRQPSWVCHWPRRPPSPPLHFSITPLPHRQPLPVFAKRTHLRMPCLCHALTLCLDSPFKTLFLALFAENQLKCLSMNNLQLK